MYLGIHAVTYNPIYLFMNSFSNNVQESIADFHSPLFFKEYTEELYKQDLHDPDNHDGVITHLESDILECKSSGPQEALLQTKLVEVMKFQLRYFKS